MSDTGTYEWSDGCSNTSDDESLNSTMKNENSLVNQPSNPSLICENKGL